MTDYINNHPVVKAAQARLHENALGLLQQINESGLPYAQSYAEYVEVEIFFFDNYDLKSYQDFVAEIESLTTFTKVPVIF